MACLGRSDFENVGEWEVTIERRHQSPFSHKSLGGLTVLSPPPTIRDRHNGRDSAEHTPVASGKGSNRLENSASSMMGDVWDPHLWRGTPARVRGGTSGDGAPRSPSSGGPRGWRRGPTHTLAALRQKTKKESVEKKQIKLMLAAKPPESVKGIRRKLGKGREGNERDEREKNGSLARFYQTAVRRHRCESIYTTTLTIPTDGVDLMAFFFTEWKFSAKKSQHRHFDFLNVSLRSHENHFRMRPDLRKIFSIPAEKSCEEILTTRWGSRGWKRASDWLPDGGVGLKKSSGQPPPPNKNKYPSRPTFRQGP